MSDESVACCGCSDPLARRTFLLSVAATIAAACAGPTYDAAARRERDLLDQAAELSRRAAVDLHSHPGPFAGRAAFPGASRELGPALADMRQARLDAALFSLPTDRPVIRNEPGTGTRQFRQPEPGELFRFAETHFDTVLGAMIGVVARSPGDVVERKRAGTPCAILALEGADALEGDLTRVRHFYDRGVRVVQLVHYRINELGDIMTEPPHHGSLTAFGRDVVRELNRLGVVVDVAHAHADTVRAVLAESRHPVLDSHTRPAAVFSSRRARPDDELRAVAAAGGVIAMWPLTRAQQGETFEDFLRAIDHLRGVVGVDHVGIGTDVNGLRGNTAVPTHREFALVPAGLLTRAYADADVARVIGGNFMRLFREVAGRG
jgi:membrane dipeptidase